jgi:hypothetical protein
MTQRPRRGGPGASIGVLDAGPERWMSDAHGRLRRPRFAVVLAICYALFTATYV